jgi:hypothetical protein
VTGAGAALFGHLWTVLPTMRDLLLPPSSLPPREVSIAIADDRFGPTSLSASLSVPEGAQDLVVLVHGLGGHRRAGYVQRAAAMLQQCGFATLALDLRGADRRGGGFYHVALADDLVAACSAPALREFRRLFVLGFSMGGHVALHFAARDPVPRLAGVAALCTPLDLQQTQQHLDGSPRAFYRRYVLSGLKQIYAAVAARHQVPAPWREVRACRTFWEWDTLTITRRYGYDGPAAFYAANSARGVLERLRVDSTLVVVDSDPIVPPDLVLPYVGVGSRLRVCRLRRGGHLQFPRGQSLGLPGSTAAAAGLSVIAQLAAWWREGC